MLPLPHSPAGGQTLLAVQTGALKTFAAAVAVVHQSSERSAAAAAGSFAVAGSFGNFAAAGNSAAAEVVAAGNSGTSAAAAAAALAFASLHLGSPAPEQSSWIEAEGNTFFRLHLVDTDSPSLLVARLLSPHPQPLS